MVKLPWIKVRIIRRIRRLQTFDRKNNFLRTLRNKVNRKDSVWHPVIGNNQARASAPDWGVPLGWGRRAWPAGCRVLQRPELTITTRRSPPKVATPAGAVKPLATEAPAQGLLYDSGMQWREYMELGDLVTGEGGCSLLCPRQLESWEEARAAPAPVHGHGSWKESMGRPAAAGDRPSPRFTPHQGRAEHASFPPGLP